jgi:hypothetical protein
MSGIRVRPAQIADAAILAEMANDLNDHVGIHTRPFSSEKVRVDVFGPQPAFTGRRRARARCRWSGGVHTANYARSTSTAGWALGERRCAS